jgi:hypothetical protein
VKAVLPDQKRDSVRLDLFRNQNKRRFLAIRCSAQRMITQRRSYAMLFWIVVIGGAGVVWLAYRWLMR